jgi:DNA-binding transcriptional LysR family regulator
MGIALATRVMAGDELRTGQLTQLLEAWQLAPAEIHAIFPAGPKLSAKVRAIVDHLVDSLSTPY